MDALALRGYEGRATLRKAVGSCEEALIRGCPNGETHLRCQGSEPSDRLSEKSLTTGGWFLISDTKYLIPEYMVVQKLTQGPETSQYLEERRSTDTPLVVASERGPGQ